MVISNLPPMIVFINQFPYTSYTDGLRIPHIYFSFEYTFSADTGRNSFKVDDI